MGWNRLVVVGDLDLLGSGGGPDEADAVLVVDSDRVLTGAVPSQGMEPVAARDAEVPQIPSGVEEIELPEGARGSWKYNGGRAIGFRWS